MTITGAQLQSPIPDPHKNGSTGQDLHSGKAWEVAKDFETLFASIMLRSMRNTVPDSGMVEKSFGESVYTEMLDSEYAKLMTNNSSMGLAEQIVKQINEIEHRNSQMMQPELDVSENAATNPQILNNAQKNTPIGNVREKLAGLENYITEASNTYHIDKDLISAIIAQESGGNRFAVSNKGAKGLMQLIDTTAAAMGVDKVFDARQNIMGGTKYLASLLQDFAGNESMALASYNAGPAAVKRYKGIPPFIETRDYVARVQRIKDTFKNTPPPSAINKGE